MHATRFLVKCKTFFQFIGSIFTNFPISFLLGKFNRNGLFLDFNYAFIPRGLDSVFFFSNLYHRRAIKMVYFPFLYLPEKSISAAFALFLLKVNPARHPISNENVKNSPIAFLFMLVAHSLYPTSVHIFSFFVSASKRVQLTGLPEFREAL